MTEIFTKIYDELWGTDTSLLIWTLFGFLVIVFISRRIGKLKELKNRDKLLLMIDIVLFPIMIVLFHFISNGTCPNDLKPFCPGALPPSGTRQYGISIHLFCSRTFTATAHLLTGSSRNAECLLK